MSVRTAIANLKGVAPYSQSRSYELEHPKKDKEGFADYEKRTWMHRLHVNDLGNVVQPALGYKNGLAAAAKFLSRKIPGARNATYTKHFQAGILVLSDSVLSIKKEDVKSEALFVPSDGVTGGGKRVWKFFPRIDDWAARVQFEILDDKITKDEFLYTLKEFGRFIGIGRFRPERGGYYGRFKIIGDIEWEEEVE